MVASRNGPARLHGAADHDATFTKNDSVIRFDPTNHKLLRVWRLRTEADLDEKRLLTAATMPTPSFADWMLSLRSADDTPSDAELWSLRAEYAKRAHEDEEARRKVFNYLVRLPGVLDARVLDIIDRVLGPTRDGRLLFKLLCNEGSFSSGPRQNNIRRKLAEVHAAAYGDGPPPQALSPVSYHGVSKFLEDYWLLFVSSEDNAADEPAKYIRTALKLLHKVDERLRYYCDQKLSEHNRGLIGDARAFIDAFVTECETLIPPEDFLSLPADMGSHAAAFAIYDDSDDEGDLSMLDDDTFAAFDARRSGRPRHLPKIHG